MYKLVLFDFDGTLLNSDPMIKVTFLELFKKYRPEFKPDDSLFFEFSGPPIKITLKNQFPDEDQELVLKEFTELSRKNYEKFTKPYPFVEMVFEALLEKNISFGLITNKARPATDHALEINGLAKYLKYSITSNDVKEQKPSPEGILKAMKDFNIIDKSQVLYVGDSNYDYLTAKNAGVDFGYASWSPRKLQDDAKIAVKIKDYKDFAEKIRNEKI